ncbi:legume-like lectin [Piptocephalis cylindrospora]|uniref:Legume-like lectin n=1 Tax=Piptocephalis cylindrospora TaxID=1907219 RepID=A0A4P9Y5W3_9FUNG|nr:legume-like lectin [Piptocephalis cylindrospora]|eukprot:RKP13611.1 legume-like lectin [Piptocephalis cylindrospora]
MRILSTPLAFVAGLLTLGGLQARNSDFQPEELEPIRSLSLHVPFVDEEMRIRFWDYGGDTILNTNKYIRLTADQQSRAGWIWSKKPLPNDAWQTEFEFDIHGGKGHLYGDGMAFWATKNRAEPGPVFGSRDRFEGLGIFFDTYKNSPSNEKYFPIITAMIGDGKTPYDTANDGLTQSIGTCEFAYRGNAAKSKARVTYFRKGMLKLEIKYDGAEAWAECFTAHNTKLPKDVFLGFSAHTGEVHDNHDVVYVSSNRILSKPPPNSQPMNGPSGSGNFGGPASSGSAIGWFFKLVLLTLVCGVAFVGYRTYVQGSSRRF